MIIQKLVMQHDRPMSEIRHQQLIQTGFPYFKSSAKSRSLATSNDLTVPSDIHMYWEFCGQNTKIVERLSVILVGNSTPPDLSSYSKAKSIIFSGHICSIETALMMVSQLTGCENVEFILGTEEQLPMQLSRNRNEFQISSSVHSLKISTAVGKQSTNAQEIKDIVLNQMQTLLQCSAATFPKLKKCILDVPDDGAYLDIVKESLSKWSTIGKSHSVVVRGGKIQLALARKIGLSLGPYNKIQLDKDEAQLAQDSQRKNDPSEKVESSKKDKAAYQNKQAKIGKGIRACRRRQSSLDCVSCCSTETEATEIEETEIKLLSSPAPESKINDLFDVTSGFGEFWGTGINNGASGVPVSAGITSVHLMHDRPNIRQFNNRATRERSRSPIARRRQLLEEIQRNDFYIPPCSKNMLSPPPSLNPLHFFSSVAQEAQRDCHTLEAAEQSGPMSVEMEIDVDNGSKIHPSDEKIGSSLDEFENMFDRRPTSSLQSDSKDGFFLQPSAQFQTPAVSAITSEGVIRLDLMFKEKEEQKQSSGLSSIIANY